MVRISLQRSDKEFAERGKNLAFTKSILDITSPLLFRMVIKTMHRRRKICLPSKSTQESYKNAVVCAFQEYRTALFFFVFSIISWFFSKDNTFHFNGDVIWFHFWMPSWLFGLTPFDEFSHLWFVVFLFPAKNHRKTIKNQEYQK